MDIKNIFKKNKLKDTKPVIIENELSIPFNEFEDQKDITIVVITKDETALEKVAKVITEYHEEHKEKNINVVISSSYEKLHRLSGGVF